MRACVHVCVCARACACVRVCVVRMERRTAIQSNLNQGEGSLTHHATAVRTRPGSGSTLRSSSRRCLSCVILARSASPGLLASPGPTRPAWIAGQQDDDANGDGSIVAESSYEAVASAAQRDFSFKGDATSETLRDLEDKLVKLKDEGLLNAYTGLALEVETCRHTWYSKTQTILIKLRNSLLRLKAMAAESLPSDGASILQYASISHREGRLGACEIYLVMRSKESTTPTRKLLLHTKLKTQWLLSLCSWIRTLLQQAIPLKNYLSQSIRCFCRGLILFRPASRGVLSFPNVSVIMKMLLKMLPRVIDFDEHRRVVALLADDNADLRFGCFHVSLSPPALPIRILSESFQMTTQPLIAENPRH